MSDIFDEVTFLAAVAHAGVGAAATLLVPSVQQASLLVITLMAVSFLGVFPPRPTLFDWGRHLVLPIAVHWLAADKAKFEAYFSIIISVFLSACILDTGAFLFMLYFLPRKASRLLAATAATTAAAALGLLLPRGLVTFLLPCLRVAGAAKLAVLTAVHSDAAPSMGFLLPLISALSTSLLLSEAWAADVLYDRVALLFCVVVHIYCTLVEMNYALWSAYGTDYVSIEAVVQADSARQKANQHPQP